LHHVVRYEAFEGRFPTGPRPAQRAGRCLVFEPMKKAWGGPWAGFTGFFDYGFAEGEASVQKLPAIGS